MFPSWMRAFLLVSDLDSRAILDSGSRRYVKPVFGKDAQRKMPHMCTYHID